jgi:hypothetical protein
MTRKFAWFTNVPTIRVHVLGDLTKNIRQQNPLFPKLFLLHPPRLALCGESSLLILSNGVA